MQLQHATQVWASLLNEPLRITRPTVHKFPSKSLYFQEKRQVTIGLSTVLTSWGPSKGHRRVLDHAPVCTLYSKLPEARSRVTSLEGGLRVLSCSVPGMDTLGSPPSSPVPLSPAPRLPYYPTGNPSLERLLNLQDWGLQVFPLFPECWNCKHCLHSPCAVLGMEPCLLFVVVNIVH